MAGPFLFGAKVWLAARFGRLSRLLLRFGRSSAFTGFLRLRGRKRCRAFCSISAGVCYGCVFLSLYGLVGDSGNVRLIGCGGLLVALVKLANRCVGKSFSLDGLFYSFRIAICLEMLLGLSQRGAGISSLTRHACAYPKAFSRLHLGLSLGNSGACAILAAAGVSGHGKGESSSCKQRCKSLFQHGLHLNVVRIK